MARALSQILQELNNVYNPQRDVYNQRLTALPDEMAAEEKGLEAAKQDAFTDITQQANRRGLFYSGIPVQEQQKYTGATFLPAVANMRNTFRTRGFNLQDALAQLTQKQYESAYGIHQGELGAEAEAARARAGAGSASPSFGFGGGATPAVQGATTNPILQAAYDDVQGRLQGSSASIKSDYAAALRWFQKTGNERDRQKILLYHQLRPDLFNRKGVAGDVVLRNAPRY